MRGVAPIVVTNEYDARHFCSLLAPMSLLATRLRSTASARGCGAPLALPTGLVLAVTFAMRDYYTLVQGGADEPARVSPRGAADQWRRAHGEKIADARFRPQMPSRRARHVVRQSPILYA